MNNGFLKYFIMGILTLGYIILSVAISSFIGGLLTRLIGDGSISILSVVISLVCYVFLLILWQKYLVKNNMKPTSMVAFSCILPFIYGIYSLIMSLINNRSCGGLDILSDNWGYVFCKVGNLLGIYISLYIMGIIAFTIFIIKIIDKLYKRKNDAVK